MVLYFRRHIIWARRDAAIVQLMLGAGLRVGEVAALKVTDVEVRDRSGQVTVRLGKGNKHRTVPLNADVRAEVAAWLAVRPETDDEALFVSRRENGLGRRALQRVVEKLGNEADVEEATPHVLRHSFAKNLVDAGVSLEKVAEPVGDDAHLHAAEPAGSGAGGRVSGAEVNPRRVRMIAEGAQGAMMGA